MSLAPPEPVGHTPPASRVRHGVLTLLCAAAMIAYLGRNCISVFEDTIRDELDLSLERMGWVMSAFFWSYAVMQIPGAWLGQVWGSRRTLAFYALAWSIATAATGLAGGFWMLFMLRLVLGATQAGLFPCSAGTISHWIPGSRTALAGGLLGSFMSVGGAIAVALTSLMLTWEMSYPAIFMVYAVPGLLWAVLFYGWFRDRPEQHRQVNPAELRLIRGTHDATERRGSAKAEQNTTASAHAETFDTKTTEHHEPTPWRTIFSSPAMWMISGQQFFRAAGYIFYASWFPTFLKETRGVSTAQAGFLTSLPMLAIVVGSPVGGMAVDALWNRTGSRRISRQLVGVLSMISCAGLIFAAYFVNDAVIAVLLISAGSFWAGVASPCTYAVTIDMGGKHIPTVFSIMNMAGNFGAAVCPVVVAWFVEATDGNWQLVLLLFVGIYLAAAACWALLNPAGSITGRL